jgi:hypothetical protein
VIALSLGLALALTSVPAAQEADAGEPGRLSESPQPIHAKIALRTREAGGLHWRLTSSRGALHVWIPPGYNARTAGVLVYLHGYYTDVDEAWEQHGLLEQFHGSGRNALFLVPESPVANPDGVKWDDLGLLLDLVLKKLRIQAPRGAVVAMGHSGAFRTLVPWLASPRLDQIVLLDGLYFNEADFAAWLKNGASGKSHRMIIVGFETLDRTDQMLAAFPTALIRDFIPRSLAQFGRRERQAQVLFLRSQYGHMELVTERKIIPMLLGLVPFEPL